MTVNHLKLEPAPGTTATLDVHDVAYLTGVVRRTVDRWVTSGKLTSFKLGGKRRFRPDDLLDFMLVHKPAWHEAFCMGFRAALNPELDANVRAAFEQHIKMGKIQYIGR